MSDKPEQSKELLIVALPFTHSDHLVITDPRGNQVVFPSRDEKEQSSQFALPATILTKDGTELCKIPQKQAASINNPGSWEAITAIFTRKYTVDAPPNSIPNLCKKDEARSK